MPKVNRATRKLGQMTVGSTEVEIISNLSVPLRIKLQPEASNFLDNFGWILSIKDNRNVAPMRPEGAHPSTILYRLLDILNCLTSLTFLIYLFKAGKINTKPF